MAALDFPDSPSNGDEFSGYVYDSAKGVWNRLPTLPALDLVAFSATAPSSPQDGQFWFDTTSSKMYVYYNDGSSSQWVSTIGGFNELNAIDDVVISSATAGQALTYDGTNWVNGGAGKVLQVVSVTKTNTFSTPSTSFTDIPGLSATITPSSATSKILVQVQVYASSAGNTATSFSLLRGATDISSADNYVYYHRSNLGVDSGAREINYSIPVTYLDSPATTSATTYKVQTRTENASLPVYINVLSFAGSYAAVSSITLMEVAG